MSTLKFLGLAALLVAFSATARSEDDKTDYKKLIVGKWEVSKADEGTVPEGTQVEFTKDGKLKIAAKMGDEDFKLYIDPETCIDCGACVPVCPVQAIFPLEELPEKWANYTQIDADWYAKRK